MRPEALASSRSALERADRILGAFGATHPTLSLGGLIARSGLPKTTVYRTTEKMIELGWLRHDADRYSIGRRLFDLAAPAGLGMRLRDAALPFMEDLHEATHETVRLGVLEEDDVVNVELLLRRGAPVGLGRVGSHLPAYCTAVGKVLLAFAEPALLEDVVRAGLPARTPHTIVSPANLCAELTAVRQARIAFDREECELGVVCVAAPVLVGPFCAAGLSISGFAARLNPDRHVAAVQAAALGIARAIRYPRIR